MKVDEAAVDQALEAVYAARAFLGPPRKSQRPGQGSRQARRQLFRRPPGASAS